MADQRPNGNGNGNGHASVLTREAFEDATAYPLLTDDMGAYDRPDASATQRGAGASGIGRLVDGAIRDVLAWRPKADDPKAFVSALNQAFDLRQVEGHVEWDWVQR